HLVVICHKNADRCCRRGGRPQHLLHDFALELQSRSNEYLSLRNRACKRLAREICYKRLPVVLFRIVISSGSGQWLGRVGRWHKRAKAHLHETYVSGECCAFAFRIRWISWFQSSFLSLHQTLRSLALCRVLPLPGLAVQIPVPLILHSRIPGGPDPQSESVFLPRHREQTGSLVRLRMPGLPGTGAPRMTRGATECQCQHPPQERRGPYA